MVGSKLDVVTGRPPYEEGTPIGGRRADYRVQGLSLDQLNRLQTAVYQGGRYLEEVMRELDIS